MKGIISEEEIKNSSKLIIEEIEGNIFNGKKIEINAGGMIGTTLKTSYMKVIAESAWISQMYLP